MRIFEDSDPARSDGGPFCANAPCVAARTNRIVPAVRAHHANSAPTALPHTLSPEADVSTGPESEGSGSAADGACLS